MGISVDDPETSRKLHERLGLGFDLLSDPELVVAGRYGVAMADGGLAIPAVVVVSTRGEIAFKEVGERADDRIYVMDLLAEVERVSRRDRP